jgi:hypothetical protein
MAFFLPFEESLNFFGKKSKEPGMAYKAQKH